MRTELSVGVVFVRDIVAFVLVSFAGSGKRGSCMPGCTAGCQNLASAASAVGGLVITHSITCSKDLGFNSPIRLSTFEI